MYNSFTIEQSEAIKHKSGAMLVLAGPGSGKTTVITNRVRELVEAGIPAESILVLTYTKTAAVEMQKRYEKLLGQDSMVSFGTFHRIFFSIICKKYKINATNIASEKFKHELLRQIIYKYEKNIFDEEELISNLANEIAKVKRCRLDPSSFCSNVITLGRFKDAFDTYRQGMISEQLIDFEDMEIIAYNLLSKDREVLSYWKNKFKYILIDEFQDINRIQYDAIRLLLDENNNIFVVGDDDQVIYSFRGSDPSIMLQFKHDFDECKIINLSQNFRCRQKIVEYSKRLIAENKDRYKKDIFTNKPKGEVIINEYENEHNQAKSIVEKAMNLVKDGHDPNKIAILTRLNYHGNIIAYNFAKYGIDYRMRGSIPDIYKHWAIEDILAYYRYSFDNFDIKDLLRMSNRPCRYIKRDAIINSCGNFKQLKYFYRSDFRMIGRISDFEEDLRIIRKSPNFEEAVKYILHGINYFEYISEFTSKNGIDIEQVQDIIQTLIEVCGSCKNYSEVEKNINEHKDSIQRSKELRDGINIMTIHSAKGLEFRTVFIPNLNEDIIPYKKNDDNDEEEERRLMYVAMTRAIDNLYISYVKTILGKNKKKSIFIDSLTNIAAK